MLRQDRPRFAGFVDEDQAVPPRRRYTSPYKDSAGSHAAQPGGATCDRGGWESEGHVQSNLCPDVLGGGLLRGIRGRRRVAAGAARAAGIGHARIHAAPRPELRRLPFGISVLQRQPRVRRRILQLNEERPDDCLGHGTRPELRRLPVPVLRAGKARRIQHRPVPDRGWGVKWLRR